MHKIGILSFLIALGVTSCGGTVDEPSNAESEATSARIATVTTCLGNAARGGRLVGSTSFVPGPTNFWSALYSYPNSSYRDLYLDDQRVCQPSQIVANVLPANFKYTQGRCACSNGSIQTCSIN